MIEKYIEILNGIGESMHLGVTTSLAIAEGIAVVTLLVLGILLYFLARFIISKTVNVLIRRTPSKYDDLFVKNKVFIRICLLIPAILIKYYLKSAMPDFPGAADVILKITKIYEITVYASIMMALVNSAHELYNSFESSKLKPIEGLVQVIKGVIIAVSVLLITTFLLGKSLYSILIGLGTISAVLMLIFQDSIKGFVGSIQLSINDIAHWRLDCGGTSRWHRSRNQPHLGKGAELGQHHHYHPDLHTGLGSLHQLARHVGVGRSAHCP